MVLYEFADDYIIFNAFEWFEMPFKCEVKRV